MRNKDKRVAVLPLFYSWLVYLLIKNEETNPRIKQIILAIPTISKLKPG